LVRIFVEFTPVGILVSDTLRLYFIFQLSEELTGSLKSLKPEGNLLTDRFKSMQKRNIIETRVKQKIVKNKRKRKLVVKRNYKMGFDWEKNRPGKLK
jgi:hypothetical protein